MKSAGTFPEIDFRGGEYVIDGKNRFTFDQAIRIWKTKYQNFLTFKREIILKDILEPLGDMVREKWDKIQPFSKEEMEALFPPDRQYYQNAQGISNHKEQSTSPSYHQSFDNIINQIKNYRA